MKKIILPTLFIFFFGHSAWTQNNTKALYFDTSNTQTVLVLTATAGYVHVDAIPAGKKLIALLGEKYGYNVLHTKDPKALKKIDFSTIDTLIFLCTTLDILNNRQQAMIKDYIRKGGGYVGIHAAADTEYEWPWYGQLVGAYFESHPEGTPRATITTIDTNNPFTNHLPASWSIEDEWYNFTFKNKEIIPLLNLEESSFEGGKNGPEHPITWYHNYDGGRAFYTGLGHRGEVYEDERFIELLQKGIAYTMKKP